MMRVTIEIIPGGDESRAEKIGVAEIENIGPHPMFTDRNYCQYRWHYDHLTDNGGFRVGGEHPHLHFRPNGALVLAAKVLAEADYSPTTTRPGGATR